MSRHWPNQQGYLNAALRTVQYLASLTVQQDIWSEVGKVFVNFWGADVVTFGRAQDDGSITYHHWTYADHDVGTNLTSLITNLSRTVAHEQSIGAEVQEAVQEVFESGFFASRIVATPESLSLAFLPVNQENQITAVLLVGYRIAEPFPRELLNIYLAMTVLLGTTATRLASEIEIRQHREHLENLVKERTTRLLAINERLQQEIADRKRAEQIIKEMAYQDALTGLPNRRLFNDRLAIAMANAQRKQQKLAVMLLDIDRFKQINDTLGHSVGDQLLQALGQRLSTLIRRSDTAARLGGDEFILILTEIITFQNATAIAEKIQAALHKDFYLDNHRLTITSSLGIALFPDDGTDAETLLKHADSAMYQAKEAGYGEYRCWQPLSREAQE
ncbi:diguanylate cyclase [Candidatus Chloroploca sp. M-50]|uniref:Diguanylate cyclase n=1 Tax=Candidatus Chloroploca mongolica TaxID=2528176 RepID=A0ABS4DG91_9CHLR|nr:GGDEF domain-containing protein [Candidatus Chloroploca mongolica]MBP1468389.1 diguanylate cyclase [Candidatus Chloroploca mongolica]